jgi:hypothetical protein
MANFSHWRLSNLNEAKPPFNPDAEKGHKPLVKGVLIRDSNGDRINTSTVSTVASTCPPVP